MYENLLLTAIILMVIISLLVNLWLIIKPYWKRPFLFLKGGSNINIELYTKDKVILKNKLTRFQANKDKSTKTLLSGRVVEILLSEDTDGFLTVRGNASEKPRKVHKSAINNLHSRGECYMDKYGGKGKNMRINPGDKVVLKDNLIVHSEVSNTRDCTTLSGETVTIISTNEDECGYLKVYNNNDNVNKKQYKIKRSAIKYVHSRSNGECEVETKSARNLIREFQEITQKYVVFLEDHCGFKKGEVYKLAQGANLENANMCVVSKHINYDTLIQVDPNKVAFSNSIGEPYKLNISNDEKIKKYSGKCRVYFPEDYCVSNIAGTVQDVNCASKNLFKIIGNNIVFPVEDVVVVEGSFENIHETCC